MKSDIERYAEIVKEYCRQRNEWPAFDEKGYMAAVDATAKQTAIAKQSLEERIGETRFVLVTEEYENRSYHAADRITAMREEEDYR